MPRLWPAAAILFYATPLWAVENAQEEAGLPQFNTAHFPTQLFWLAVCFGLLYCLMAFVALPGVARTQEKRHAVIQAELKAAEEANREAKHLIAQYEKALADARAQAQAMIAERAAAAAKAQAEAMAQQHKEFAKRFAEAEAKIVAARDAALTEARAQADQLALLIAEKIVGH